MSKYINRILLGVIALTVITPLFIFGQSLKIDSLKQTYAQNSQPSTAIELAEILTLSNTDSAIYFLKQVEKNSLSEEGRIQFDKVKGRLLTVTNQYDSAVLVYTDLLRILEGKSEYLKLEADILDNVGGIYLTLRENDQSLDFINRAKKIREVNGLKSEIHKSYYSLGNFLFRTGKSREAVNNYRKGLSLLTNKTDTSFLANLNYMMGTAYNILKQNDSSLYFLQKAKVMYDQTHQVISQINTANSMAQAMISEQRFSEAIPLLENNIKLLESNGDWQKYMAAYSQLSKAYEGLEDYKNALAYQKLRYDTVVGFLAKQRTQSVAKITEDYRTDKQLDEAEEVAFYATQRAKIFGGIAVGLIMLLIISYLLFSRTIQRKKLENLRAMILGEENERKRVAKDLHDGIGVLLTSVKMRLSNFEDKIEDKVAFQSSLGQIDNACSEVRRISHNMVPASLSKLGLEEAMLDLFDNVTASTQIEIQEKLSYEEGDFEESSEVLIYRVIQELVNNTLKYAKASSIQVKMGKLKEEYIIEYKDNGIGFDKTKVKNGLGLKSIASRIDILKGKLTFDSIEGKGVSFKINIPLQHG
ncbi:tetratricopeptide repeat-containing sensor histidine kinase [Roseivirga sp.]|uniref:tetratricopeptide repeat-containing sensor histidine kinase n=1 Tax=Roseivirga sp. TaxID=1964215 RepID=UPI002B271516|nr:ATP-binding protein [Roseivirga sp.]